MAMERDLPSESGETGLKPDYQLWREKAEEEEEEKEQRTKSPRESGGGWWWWICFGVEMAKFATTLGS